MIIAGLAILDGIVGPAFDFPVAQSTQLR